MTNAATFILGMAVAGTISLPFFAHLNSLINEARALAAERRHIITAMHPLAERGQKRLAALAKAKAKKVAK